MFRWQPMHSRTSLWRKWRMHLNNVLQTSYNWTTEEILTQVSFRVFYCGCRILELILINYVKMEKKKWPSLSIASANPAGRGVSTESDLKEVFPHEAPVMLKDSNQRYDEAMFSYIHLFAIYIYSSVIFSRLGQFQLIQHHEINWNEIAWNVFWNVHGWLIDVAINWVFYVWPHFIFFFVLVPRLTCLWAWRLHRRESLHPLRHPVRVSVGRNAIKGTSCIMKFLYTDISYVVNFSCAKFANNSGNQS
jgi:hypothetical protein